MISLLILICLAHSCLSFTAPGTVLESAIGPLYLRSTYNSSGVAIMATGSTGEEIIELSVGAATVCTFDSDGLTMGPSMTISSGFAVVTVLSSSVITALDSLVVGGSVNSFTITTGSLTSGTISSDSVSTDVLSADSIVAGTITTDVLQSMAGDLDISATQNNGRIVLNSNNGSIVFEVSDVPVAHVGPGFFGVNSLVVDTFFQTDYLFSATAPAINAGPLAMGGDIDLGANFLKNGYINTDVNFGQRFDDDTLSSLGVALGHETFVGLRFNNTILGIYDFPPLSTATSDTVVLVNTHQILANKEISFTTSGGTPSVLNFHEKSVGTYMLTLGGAIPRTNITINVTRLSNQVTLALPNVQVTCNSSVSISTFAPFSTLPSQFWPITDYYFPMIIVNGSPNFGRVTLFATGSIKIDSDEAGTGFHKPNTVGFLATTLHYLAA